MSFPADERASDHSGLDCSMNYFSKSGKVPAASESTRAAPFPDQTTIPFPKNPEFLFARKFPSSGSLFER
jgi:hypothetical protein